MILLLDVGNTNTHVGLANAKRIFKRLEFPTEFWKAARLPSPLAAFCAGHSVTGAAYCQVVPGTLQAIRRFMRSQKYESAQLTADNVAGLEFRYPHPGTLGADRVARVLAATRFYGAPVVCLGFGTALTIDVVDGGGRFIGGIIAPGIGAFRDYLHEKTAQLPKVSLRPVSRFIGRGTEEAMRIGCWTGFHGMVSELIRGVRQELGQEALVVATGGYARMAASKVAEINMVNPDLTLEGLRLFWIDRAR